MSIKFIIYKPSCIIKCKVEIELDHDGGGSSKKSLKKRSSKKILKKKKKKKKKRNFYLPTQSYILDETWNTQFFGGGPKNATFVHLKALNSVLLI